MPLLGEKKFNVINQSKPRIDGVEKVTGAARYAADMYMENMLYAGVLRSPYASARVTSIKTAAAKAIEGVEAVVTYADMPRNKSWAGYMYLTGHVKYAGDCVAMVAAKSKALVLEALAAIEVEYEELPGVYTIDEALEEGAPLVHEQYEKNIFKDSMFHIRKGDIEKGFEKADVIIEREYRTQYVEHSYIEPEAVLAYQNPNDGVMTAHASAQNPFFTRRYIADALGVPYESIRFPGVDSFSIPDCGMTVASRGTVMGSQSVRKTGEKLKKIMIQNALELQALPLEQAGLSYEDITAGDLDLKDGRFYLKSNPQVGADLAGVCNACLWTGKQLSAFEWFIPNDLRQDHDTGPGTAFPTYAYGCVVAEVEVDMRTGYVDVTKVTSSHDVGTAINPALIKGQIYGGIVMGQGYSIMEDVAPVKGRVKIRNFDSYILPTSMDAPEMDIHIFECGDESGTYGAKSVGEPATEAVGAAIANAVYNATGRRIRQNPCDLESVLLGKKLR